MEPGERKEGGRDGWGRMEGEVERQIGWTSGSKCG